ncbi:metallophosphoesterase family protein [Steroidobacter agaridevorans]|nr:metallophosphoesterase family protein [Steroidobacter agaridevorans]GFE85538.1 phosphoesterase [Steroidobacter agaridevorans]
MKLGIVSDIHANPGALRRAFDLMGDVDRWICLGDCINQFRFSNEVVRELRDRDVCTIWGNHEEVFFSAQGMRARAEDWIEPELLIWLSRQQKRRELQLEGKRVLLVHSTPWESGGAYILPSSSEFKRFGEVAADIVMYGHIHCPVATRVAGTLVINPGSTGEGRPTSQGFISSCAVLDLESEAVEHFDFIAD